ncbi:MraY family glycosyltransferase [Helicobacter sp. 11S02596-1]|uniref:glycosyltransferase family 4 protein n=1 Tax=Helicobacter sp. 11S02596-1 TaxID=1476194 RepID=UPI000BA6E048|nr:MraY family glycosyltransferase [Helicobacter sp. 11S02596-1]PAF44738.1 hypothetical protein BJI48_01755 [Helicobacter sp. 11S02596-1]
MEFPKHTSLEILAQIGVAGFLISLVSSLIVIFLSKKFRIFIDTADSAKPQRFHFAPTPRSGGIGIFLSFVLVGLAGLEHTPASLYFLAGLAIIFFSGLMEDFSASLSPKARLFIQLVGVGVGVFGMGVVITDLSPVVILPYGVGVAFSLFGIVGVCNAINIIDGFNGLAGGICAMAFVAIGIAGAGDMFVLWVCVVGLGATLGFLALNFPKGKIFLGDGGAYMLGFILAILLAILSQSDRGISAWFGLLVMIYPVWEVVFSIIRRRLQKQSAMQPDGKHLHTLIYQKVQDNPLTAVLIWLLNLPFMVLAVVFMHEAWVLIGLCGVFVVVYSGIYFVLSASIK